LLLIRLLQGAYAFVFSQSIVVLPFRCDADDNSKAAKPFGLILWISIDWVGV